MPAERLSMRKVREVLRLKHACGASVRTIARWVARGDGRYGRLLKTLGRVQLLILDDWGLAPLPAEQRRDLLEIIDDRHERGSTIVTSQVPVDHWHEVIGDSTLS